MSLFPSPLPPLSPSSNSPTARLIEVFSAIQGEGLNVGTRQLFIRFAICDLRCRFCDSAHTWHASATCQIERTAGLRDFETHSNPVEMATLLEWVSRQNQPGLHDSISITGGEPLLHAPFLAEFLPLVRAATGLPIYLETGGHHPEQLAMILPDLDLVGMDIKLPSVSGESHWPAHAEFLQLCNASQVQVFVKLIISDQTDPAELEKTAELVAGVNPEVPVFLQPVTALGKDEGKSVALFSPPSPEQVLEWQALMKCRLKHVRVVPQTHKMLGQL